MGRKKWVWNINESSLSPESKRMNDILCKEFKVDSYKDFADHFNCQFAYSYYAYEEDYEIYYINLGLLIDNFKLYGHSAELLNTYDALNGKSTLREVINDYCIRHECLGGDIITSGEYWWE